MHIKLRPYTNKFQVWIVVTPGILFASFNLWLGFYSKEWILLIFAFLMYMVAILIYFDGMRELKKNKQK